MKYPILLHNSHDIVSIQFKEYLDSIGYKYCLLEWYTRSKSRDHNRSLAQTFRLINMYITGAMEGLSPPEPEIPYTEEDFNTYNFPEEYLRWNLECCDYHKESGYEGPPPRAFPSLVFENESGGFTLIDTPAALEDIINPNLSKIWSCKKGECLAGQWVESAKASALSPHYGNNLMRLSVNRFVKKYEVISLIEKDRELITINRKALVESSLIE